MLSAPAHTRCPWMPTRTHLSATCEAGHSAVRELPRSVNFGVFPTGPTFAGAATLSGSTGESANHRMGAEADPVHANQSAKSCSFGVSGCSRTDFATSDRRCALPSIPCAPAPTHRCSHGAPATGTPSAIHPGCPRGRGTTAAAAPVGNPAARLRRGRPAASRWHWLAGREDGRAPVQGRSSTQGWFLPPLTWIVLPTM